MPHPPLKWYVYNNRGDRVAAFAFGEDAAGCVALLGDGATIRVPSGALILWTEGAESQPAGESYDFVAEKLDERFNRKMPGIL